MSRPDEFVEIAVEVRVKTAKAWLCFDGKTEAWIPLSQIDDYCENKGKVTTIFVAQWIAHEKGFI